MHPMKEALTAIGVDVPKGAPDSRWFQSNGLPLMIECEKCGQATALLREYVDETGNTYCADCLEPESGKQNIAAEKKPALSKASGEATASDDGTDPEIEAALDYIFGD